MIEKSRLFNSYTIDSNDVNDEVSKFLKWMENIIDNYFPIKLKNASINRLRKPWISIQAMNFINKKHKLFIALKRKLISYAFFKAFSTVLKIYLKRLKSILQISLMYANMILKSYGSQLIT